MFVSAGLGLLACCGITYLAGEADVAGADETFLVVFTVITVVFSLFNAVLGYYILQGRQWARITTIVVCALGIAGSVIAVFAGANGEDNILTSCLGGLVNVLVIGLLSGSQASDYFRYGRR
jgi:cytochrome c oxidase subunit IV